MSFDSRDGFDTDPRWGVPRPVTKVPDRCPRCGRFKRATAGRLCAACEAVDTVPAFLEVLPSHEASTPVPPPDAGETTPRPEAFRHVRSDFVIPRPRELHPEHQNAPPPVEAPADLPEIEPMAEPEFEPMAEPEIEPMEQPEIVPMAEPEIEPMAEPEFEPMAEPEIETMAQPEFEPMARPVPRRGVVVALAVVIACGLIGSSIPFLLVLIRP